MQKTVPLCQKCWRISGFRGRREDGRDEGQKLRGDGFFKGTQIHFSSFSFSEVKRMSSCVIDNLLTFLLQVLLDQGFATTSEFMKFLQKGWPIYQRKKLAIQRNWVSLKHLLCPWVDLFRTTQRLCFSFRKIIASFLIFSVLFILTIGFYKTLFLNHIHKTFSLKTIHEMLCKRRENSC